MAMTRAGKSAKRVKDLPAKGLIAKQAKGVKGGLTIVVRSSTTASSPSSGELLPYIEQDNLSKR